MRLTADAIVPRELSNYFSDAITDRHRAEIAGVTDIHFTFVLTEIAGRTKENSDTILKSLRRFPARDLTFLTP